MNYNPPLPSQELTPDQSNGNNVVTLAQPDGDQTRRDSSEDDGPIIARRQYREPLQQRDEGMGMRECRLERDRGQNSGDQIHDRAVLRQSRKMSPSKSVSKSKKPGPRAWASKPIMKNDIKAKMEVIREIESYWGKGFIKTCIPKCHRPLVKRGAGSKRVHTRSHETNPKNWLPSVLKAILMIAKLTDDKTWLKKAMEDVVRYRIKNTGNRKPQLVTTDFDVIEDMLVKQWDVPYSFEIRYKHLLVNRKDGEQNDEDIDHILQASSDRDDDFDDDEDIGDEIRLKHEEDEDEDYDNEDRGRSRTSGKYIHDSGSTKKSNNYPPPRQRQQSEQSNGQRETLTPPKLPPQQQHEIYGYGQQIPGYGAPLDPWGRPIPGYPGGLSGYNAYGGYGGAYPGYSGYGHPGNVRQGSQQHSPRVMPAYPLPPPSAVLPSMMLALGNPIKRGPLSPPDVRKRVRTGYEQPPGFDMYGWPQPYQGGRPVKVKRESPPIDGSDDGLSDFEGPTNDFDVEEDGGEDNEAEVDAEIEAMELRLKLAQMKARKAALQQRTRHK
ncbi:hypothetical protein EK21DRAFT_100901 [Setomelanomma holmii]|uniref:Uncharacterized protein n=1 Tax=Setomelanomma holmii TaxID=210430 RepID=A0A9P4H966_9PLEO|nr:hypothetical protein EK21DRAFT_100901 [Setomelanomma holmii]